MDFLKSSTYFNNTLFQYLMALIIILVGIFSSIFIQWLLQKILTKSLDDSSHLSLWLTKSIKRYTKPLVIYIFITLALQTLTIVSFIKEWITILEYAFGTFFFAQVATTLISLFIKRGINHSDKLVKPLRFFNGLFKFIIWSIALLIFLDNIGIQITSLAASLGIGGLAIAFAAQAIFQDILSYVTISFDQPFDVGDYIVVKDISGTIEYIGLKTTRLRSLLGELVIIPNKVLTDEKIHNYKSLQKRRVVLNIGLTYQTKSEQILQAIHIIESIIKNTEGVEFDRSHFDAYKDSSLNIMTVYYILDPDYICFMDKQQSINLAIKKEFDEQGLNFAYPTQTLFIEK